MSLETSAIHSTRSVSSLHRLPYDIKMTVVMLISTVSTNVDLKMLIHRSSKNISSVSVFKDSCGTWWPRILIQSRWWRSCGWPWTNLWWQGLMAHVYDSRLFLNQTLCRGGWHCPYWPLAKQSSLLEFGKCQFFLK